MGKKSSPPPPDYSALAAASERSAQKMADLGYAQLAESRRQYEQALPMMQGIAESQLDIMQRAADRSDQFMSYQMGAMDRQLALMEENAAMGREYYDYMKQTFRPLEKELVADARKYNTRAEFERQASQAASDVARRGSVERDANERAMASMGVNPNSGRFQSLGRQQSLQQAATGAGAMNSARRAAEMTGYARKMDAAGLGRGLPGAAQGAYGLAANNASNVAGNAANAGSNSLNTAVNAGNSAGQNAMAPGQNLIAGMGQAAGTIGAGQEMMLGGLGNALSLETDAYNTAVQQQNAGLAGLGSFLGTVGGTAVSMI